ncbi:potassium/proton antiporter [Candidatus Laterigemmans baculatus]|uniref:potassium/proton antiporter n=1 Tax=Candidatus Laterigemmans baculatus TaxID=2770505 RepID=UPI0013DA409D|nr:potassium/proton antiporter [Candidatus Laterigemmans baculatus]
MEYDVPELTAMAMTAGGLLLAASCLLSRVGASFCIPVSLLFLLVGMLAGCDGPGGIEFDDFPLAHASGTIALAAVLFAGGLQTHFHTVKNAIAPAAVLASVGVVGVASITAFGAHYLGLPWGEAWLVGAIVASTDASAVFSVLQGVSLPRRVASTIELESGLNDPIAVILTLAATSLMLGQPASWAELAVQVLQQLTIGVFFGLAIGFAAREMLIRVPLSTPALTPVLTLGCALMAFGGPAMLDGSGFLAAYLAGIVVGNAPIPDREPLVHVHDSISWLGQVAMFLMLGLLVNPSDLPHVAGYGIAITLLIAFVARPLSVSLCLLPFRMKWNEKLFISWVGLRGAVPIILATVPVLRANGQSARMTEALDVFDIVFFVVVVSALIPGATVPFVARLLRLDASSDGEAAHFASTSSAPYAAPTAAQPTQAMQQSL